MFTFNIKRKYNKLHEGTRLFMKRIRTRLCIRLHYLMYNSSAWTSTHVNILGFSLFMSEISGIELFARLFLLNIHGVILFIVIPEPQRRTQRCMREVV